MPFPGAVVVTGGTTVVEADEDEVAVLDMGLVAALVEEMEVPGAGST